MKIIDFLKSSGWDAPFFKRLAHNDTGQAVGHQGGMVLPKDLRKFLPVLDENRTTASQPTVDRYLQIEMFAGLNPIAELAVRYQFQTWGGTRSAESRLTEGFQPLRNLAAEGDLMVMQRRALLLNRFRFVLVKRNTAEFRDLAESAGERRWGPLFLDALPVTQSDLSEASAEISRAISEPFRVLRTSIPRVESRQIRIARSSVFGERVRKEYSRACAVSGVVVATPTNLYEVESAHIVPLSEGGTDDIRNGFTLSQTLHWAFDKGLFGVNAARQIYIPKKVRMMQTNTYLHHFAGRNIAEASTAAARAHPDAFEWHFRALVTRWE